MRKKWILLGAACMVMGTTVSAQNVGIIINEKTAVCEVAPVIKAGTTLVPLRVIGENMGAVVKWDKDAQTITVTKGNKEIEMTPCLREVFVNGEEMEMTHAPEIINGCCMVPARFIGEQLQFEIVWNKAAQQVVVTSKAAVSKPVQKEEIKVVKSGQLTDKQIAEFIDYAYYQEVHILMGYDEKNPGKVEGYERLKEQFNSAEKIEAYLNEGFSKAYSKSFISHLGDRYKVVNGENYLILGDVGIIPAFDKATIKAKEEKEGKLTVTMEVPCEDEKGIFKAVLIQENGEWRLDALDRISEKGTAASILI